MQNADNNQTESQEQSRQGSIQPKATKLCNDRGPWNYCALSWGKKFTSDASITQASTLPGSRVPMSAACREQKTQAVKTSGT